MVQERIWLLVEYDGSAFHGSQFQFKDGHVLPTVQGAIRQALQALGFCEGEVKVHCASRTDAGVHAAGQIVQLTGSAHAFGKFRDLRRALNSQLPASLAVILCQRHVPMGQCCQQSAKVRWYRYRIDTRAGRHVWGSRNQWPLGLPLDVVAMRQASAQVIGEHDFATFGSLATGRTRETQCNVRACYVHARDEHAQIVIDIAGERFLYKMVRNLVAALVQIGLGKVSSDGSAAMQGWLAAQSRQAAPWTAPPCGLTLMAIAYQPLPDAADGTIPQRLDSGFDSWHVYAKLLNTVLNLEISQHENIFRQAR